MRYSKAGIPLLQTTTQQTAGYARIRNFLLFMVCLLFLAACGSSSPEEDLKVKNVQAVACNNQVTISWDYVGTGTIYNIYWSDTYSLQADILSKGTKIEDVTSPYVHISLTNGTTYRYVVEAEFVTYDGVPTGATSASDVVSATPLAGGCTPSTPLNVQATAGDSQVTVSWDSVTGATSYNLYWLTVPGVTTSTGNQIAGVTSPYVHISLTNGTTYYYIITAVYAIGEGSTSSEVSATPIGQYTLEVNSYTWQGGPTGRVVSNPVGIVCDTIAYGNICTWDFDANIAVTLTAIPDLGYFFDTWGGTDPCDSTGIDNDGYSFCTIIMDGNKSIIATFRTYP